MEYIPGLGVVLLILIHDRQFVLRHGIWYELIPTTHPDMFNGQAYHQDTFNGQTYDQTYHPDMSNSQTFHPDMSNSQTYHPDMSNSQTYHPDMSNNQTYEEQRHVPCIMSKETIEEQQREAEIKRIEAEKEAQLDAEWLEEMKRDAGWIEGYTYEEEEEPDFWEFIKQLGKDTDERIRVSMEQEENYMIARFDFH